MGSPVEAGGSNGSIGLCLKRCSRGFFGCVWMAFGNLSLPFAPPLTACIQLALACYMYTLGTVTIQTSRKEPWFQNGCVTSDMHFRGHQEQGQPTVLPPSPRAVSLYGEKARHKENKKERAHCATINSPPCMHSSLARQHMPLAGTQILSASIRVRLNSVCI